jgi:RepB DNA-primase from phage plasmid/CHC2 zinc finger
MQARIPRKKCRVLECKVQAAEADGPHATRDGLGAVTVNRDLSAYLDALCGESADSAFLEVRRRVAEGVLAAEFFRVGEREAIAAALGRHATHADVYVGCAPRLRRSGTKSDIGDVWVLWAECDGAAAARAAHAFRPRPPIVIASGSGPNLHAYWPLARPVSGREAERANLRLAHALGADLACYDAARILRPPGTWNHKRQPPRPVTALRVEASTRFEIAQILEHAPELQTDVVARRWQDRGERNTHRDPLLQIAPVTYVSRLLQVHARAGRKVECPLHDDERPSLHVYPAAERGWTCFSCGRGGSIYDLASALWGIGTRGRDFIELRRLLSEQFQRELTHRPPDLAR